MGRLPGWVRPGQIGPVRTDFSATAHPDAPSNPSGPIAGTALSDGAVDDQLAIASNAAS